MSIVFYAGSSGTMTYRRTLGMLLRRLERLVNRWVAASIARREREVASSMLPCLGGGAVQDVGVSKSEADVVAGQAGNPSGIHNHRPLVSDSDRR